MGEMTFAFETDRLRVFHATVTPWDSSPPSIIYAAFLKSGGAAQTVTHAVVTDQRGKGSQVLFPLYCELVETAAMFRRQGYGMELFLAIEDKLGSKMEAIAANEQGRAVRTKLSRPRDSLAPHLTGLVTMLDLLLQTATQQGKPALVEVVSALKATATDINRNPHERIQALGRMSRVIEENLPALG